MRRSLAVLALVLVVLPLPGAHALRLELRGRPPAPSAPTLDRALQGPRYDLRGRVETPERRPLEGATVRAVLHLGGRTFPLGRGTTDRGGSFVLERVPEGSYWVIVTAPGRARRVVTLRVHGGPPSALTVTMVTGASIGGTVFSQVGEGRRALPSVVVRALREGALDGLAHAARADAQGAFTLDGLEPGTYRLEVAEAGYEALRRVGIPAPAEHVTLTVRALAGLAGVVRDERGAPSPGAELLLAGSGLWPPRRVAASPEGRFEIVGLPAGVYELRAQQGELVAEPLAPLLLDPGDRREVALTVTPGVTLAGRVVDAETGRAIEGARVIVAEDALSTAPRALVTGASGGFRIAGLLRRGHQVSARAAGYAPRTGVLAVPGEGGAVELALDHAAVVTGRVVDGHGEPVVNAQVELSVTDVDGRGAWLTGATVAFREALFAAQAQGPRPLVPAGELGVMPGRVPMVPLTPMPAGVTAERSALGFTTDATGTFRVEEVPPGTFSVTVTHPAYVRTESAGRLLRGGETAEVTLTLHAGGTIEGRVLTERGFPVANTQVEVRSERDPLPRRVFTARDGTFRVPSVLGRVALVAFVGTRVAARAEADVADDATVTVALTFPGELRRLTGRVVDARGFPVAGATLAITSLERNALGSASTISQADGTFDTVMGGTGALNLEVRHPDYAPRGMRVRDTSREILVELGQGGSVTLTPRGDGCVEGELRVEARTPCGPVRVTAQDREDVRLPRLCAGRATVVVDAPGCIRAERQVTVADGREADLGRVELVSGGGAEGDVVDARRTPVAGAVVARADAPPDAVTGTARTTRAGSFSVQNLPDGDVTLVATHPTLGRSLPSVVRVIRGTTARGVILRFEGDLEGATRELGRASVSFSEEGGRVEVRAVSEGSAAERAGLRAGDRVITLNGRPVSSRDAATEQLQGALGDDVVLEVEREGTRRTVRWARERGR